MDYPFLIVAVRTNGPGVQAILTLFAAGNVPGDPQRPALGHPSSGTQTR
jgi:hypothetical protein